MPLSRSAHDASKWNPLFHDRSSIPVDALKNATGAPFAVGSQRLTSLATRAILRLFSLRTMPRFTRWVKNSFSILYR
jgi:hypothetical protein